MDEAQPPFLRVIHLRVVQGNSSFLMSSGLGQLSEIKQDLSHRLVGNVEKRRGLKFLGDAQQLLYELTR